MTESAAKAPETPTAPDLDEYLTVARPENELISLYGTRVSDLLRGRGRYLRTIDAFGWVKWVRRDSFLLNIWMTSNEAPRRVDRFLQNYGEEAFEAVMADSTRFKVDSESGRIESKPIDLLLEVERIVRDHYREELAWGHIYLIEPAEWVKRKTVSLRIHVDGSPGRYIWKGGERIRWLEERILNEVGVQARIRFVRHPPGLFERRESKTKQNL
jgi:hypothetical protein